MTTIDNAPDALAGVHHGEPTAAGRALAGVADWLTSADHKRVGRLFIGFSLLLAIGVGVVAALVGIERIDGGSNVLDSDSHLQLVSLFRVGLVFLAVLPLVVGLCVAIVPLQLGARAIAFGRAASFGFWSWFAGAVLIIISICSNGGPGGGNSDMVDLFIGGVMLAALGLAAAMAAVVISVLTTRSPGMNLRRVPMFAYSALVGGIAVVLTLGSSFGTLLLLLIDHNKAGRTAFGGNEGLLPNMGWMLGGLAMFVYVLPLLGALPDIASTITGTHSKLRAIIRFGIGLAAVATLGAVSQGPVGLLADGDDRVGTFWSVLGWLFFNGLPSLGVLVVLGAVGQMLFSPKPNIKALISAPLTFVFFGGGITLLGLLANEINTVFNWDLVAQATHTKDSKGATTTSWSTMTTAEEASAVLLAGGALLIAMGALVYWGPKLWGRKLGDKQVLPLAALAALGAVLVGAPMLISGFGGQVGNALANFGGDTSPELMNTLATVGYGLVTLAVLAFAALAVKDFTGGAAAGDDPWDGQTLEWATSSPPPANNFAELTMVSSNHPLSDLKPGKAS